LQHATQSFQRRMIHLASVAKGLIVFAHQRRRIANIWF